MMTLQQPASMTDELPLVVVSRESRPPSLRTSSKGPAAVDFLDSDKFLGGDTDDDDDDNDDQEDKGKASGVEVEVEVEVESNEQDEITTTHATTTSIDERRARRHRERQVHVRDKQTRTAKLQARSLSPNRRERSLSPPRTLSSALNADPSLQRLHQQQHPSTVHRSRSGPLSTRQTPARSLSAHVGETAVQFLEMLGFAGDDDDDDDVIDEDNFDDYRVQPHDMHTLVNDPTEFSRLKAALKERGAITNEVLRQRLHVYVHKNRSRWTSSSTSTSSTNNNGSGGGDNDNDNDETGNNLSAFRHDDD